MKKILALLIAFVAMLCTAVIPATANAAQYGCGYGNSTGVRCPSGSSSTAIPSTPSSSYLHAFTGFQALAYYSPVYVDQGNGFWQSSGQSAFVYSSWYLGSQGNKAWTPTSTYWHYQVGPNTWVFDGYTYIYNWQSGLVCSYRGSIIGNDNSWSIMQSNKQQNCTKY